MAPIGHLRAYTLRGLVALLQAHGFRMLKKQGIGINTRIGYGRKHRWLARAANCLFRSPSVNSGIMVVAQKLDAK
jgi:hypothetical protein